MWNELSYLHAGKNKKDIIMTFDIIPGSKGMRPHVNLPDPRILEYLKESGIRRLVGKHYDLLIVSKISHLFPQNSEGLDRAKEHSADFFIQILGGPKYFNEKRGQPMLVKRHIPFKIDADARIVWLECYKEALLTMEMPNYLVESYWNYLNVFSTWMINT